MFLKLIDIQKLYDKNNGVKNFNLEVSEGEFVSLLGPSGCGKTTTLNILGGFLKPDSGKIILEGEDITILPAEKRPCATVFQSYALFPNMNVIENISYGIRYLRKMKKRDAIDAAYEYLKNVGLEGYEKNRVGNLSGGQQQRVALARAMATNPKVLLLDEPLSNLDANLRVKMREELKELQKKLNITMIFVTHDQEEALCLSDKIVVMNKGEIEQIGTPRQIYCDPKNMYVASFIGKSNTIKIDDKKYFVRPEDVTIKKDDDGEYQIQNIVFMGPYTSYRISNNVNTIEVHITGQNADIYNLKDKVSISIPDKNVTINSEN